MCGVVGYVGQQQVMPLLLEGLRRLEYRGYDSSGVAVQRGSKSELAVFKRSGKLQNLVSALPAKVSSTCGIGHTRWATHGEPVEVNAHPHMAGDNVAIVHNGIIENYASIKAELIDKGHVFEGETDTEVVAHLIKENLQSGLNAREAVSSTLKRIEGAFALAILINDGSEKLYAARRGSPLVVGLGQGENYLGSDAIALASLTNKVIYLEEGDWAELTRDNVILFDSSGNEVNRPVAYSQVSNTFADKGKSPLHAERDFRAALYFGTNAWQIF